MQFPAGLQYLILVSLRAAAAVAVCFLFCCVFCDAGRPWLVVAERVAVVCARASDTMPMSTGLQSNRCSARSAVPYRPSVSLSCEYACRCCSRSWFPLFHVFCAAGRAWLVVAARVAVVNAGAADAMPMSTVWQSNR